VVGASPTGPHRTRADHPKLPLAPDEIAAAVADCLRHGACYARVHARDEAGRPTLAPRAMLAVVETVRRRTGRAVVVQPAAYAGDWATTLDIVNVAREIRPETIALRLSEIVPDERSLSEAARFLSWLARERVAPHFVLSDAGEVARYLSLRERGALPDSAHLVEFAPRPPEGATTEDVRPDALLPMIAAYRGDMPWTCAGSGRFEAALAALGCAVGGHATVGFDFNVRAPDGSAAPDSAAAVERCASTLAAIGRPLATADDLRGMIGR
jgi:3-keto-5-aminohexanoate cleavage enzyme